MYISDGTLEVWKYIHSTCYLTVIALGEYFSGPNKHVHTPIYSQKKITPNSLILIGLGDYRDPQQPWTL